MVRKVMSTIAQAFGAVQHTKQWAYIQEIQNQENDRATAIIGAAFLDSVLTDLIKKRLAKDRDTFKKLFKPSGPLGNFSTKAELGLLLGLYDKSIRDDILAIAAIRNQFAHKLELIEFGSREIRNACTGLSHILPPNVISPLPTNPKEIFVCTIQTTIYLLLLNNRP